MEAHDHELTRAVRIWRPVLANDENMRRQVSLVDTVGGEDEAERHERTHHTGGGNIAPACDVVGGLSRARR